MSKNKSIYSTQISVIIRINLIKFPMKMKFCQSGVWLFAILSVILDTLKDNQTDLVKFYVNYGAKSKYIWKL